MFPVVSVYVKVVGVSNAELSVVRPSVNFSFKMLNSQKWPDNFCYCLV